MSSMLRSLAGGESDTNHAFGSSMANPIYRLQLLVTLDVTLIAEKVGKRSSQLFTNVTRFTNKDRFLLVFLNNVSPIVDFPHPKLDFIEFLLQFRTLASRKHHLATTCGVDGKLKSDGVQKMSAFVTFGWDDAHFYAPNLRYLRGHKIKPMYINYDPLWFTIWGPRLQAKE